MAASDDLPPDAIHPATRAAWRAWLSRHHARDAGVWVVSWKVASGRPRVDYDALVEEALCFGWIDSKPRTLDELRSMLWFAPRKPGTGWSAPNKARIERLLAAGRMAPAGLAKVEAAKRDGTWSKLDAVEALEIPPDLAAALAQRPGAAEHFDAFPRSVKRGILEWIVQAKKAETRARRIDETATLAARNERANQWRPASR
ncbi:MAG: YdeI/OmpD-associated family protein [Burkholderiales bacterium]|jgi:uncharacterized protein YdeI (YjbR/CyaY-like superfamily)